MSRCVLDTDVVIGALESSDTHHADASEALLQLLDEGVSLQLSVVNYAEVLVRPSHDPSTLRRATAAMEALRIRVVAPDAGIGRAAAALRGLGVSLADGFALATAQRLDAPLATFDSRVRRAAGRAGITLR